MNDFGTIVTHAFTSDAIIPVPDTTVTISLKLPSGIYDLIAVQITDENGKTESVRIETPNKELSTIPEETAKVFTVVNITADHPLYERLLIENVQVFANTVTLQNLLLIPLEQDPQNWNETQTVNIPAQNL